MITSTLLHARPSSTKLTDTHMVEVNGISLLPKVCSALTFAML